MPHRRLSFVGYVLASVLGFFGLSAARAQEPPLKVIVFPGLSNAPLFAAQAKGFFAKRNVTLELTNTVSSDELRHGLADGRYHIAHAAIDNAVSQIDKEKVDAVVVVGGDGGLNQLYVQPDIKGAPDLKGKIVAVDAPNTAYALLLYKMLKTMGLERGSDYTVKAVGGTGQRLDAMLKDKSLAATMLNPPFSVTADKSGALKSLGSPLAITGPYQAGSAFVLKSWATNHADVLVQYLAAIIEGARWARDPVNRAELVAIFVDKLKLAPDVAEECYKLVMDEAGGGLATDLAVNMEGFKTVLTLREEFEPGAERRSPDGYFDLSYYKKALALVR
jgi:ABC-type nitrate/sulfonate/bicarbonate transport system substrate-binding protein